MSGTKLFLDTDIVIYWLNGDQTLAELLDGKHIYLSFITELELLGYSNLKPREQIAIKNLLNESHIIDINPPIKSIVIRLRKKNKLKLPDSIILASAIYLDLPLIASYADFKKIEDVDLIFYEN